MGNRRTIRLSDTFPRIIATFSTEAAEVFSGIICAIALAKGRILLQGYNPDASYLPGPERIGTDCFEIGKKLLMDLNRRLIDLADEVQIHKYDGEKADWIEELAAYSVRSMKQTYVNSHSEKPSGENKAKEKQG